MLRCMYGGKVLVCLVLFVSQFFFVVDSVVAYPQSNLLISHVITGESSSSSSELVAIFNNTDKDIKMNGYCIKNKGLVNVACVDDDVNINVYIRAQQYLTFSSGYFANSYEYTPDTSYDVSNAFQVGGDIVVLVDGEGTEVDRVSWGTSGGGITSLTNGTLVRKQDPLNSNMLLDTGNMTDDFSSIAGSLIYPINTSFDEVITVDYCANIEGLQSTVPDGYLIDSDDTCQPDSCLNIDGLQISVPDQYVEDDQGNCSPIDVCSNVSGSQPDVPYGMVPVNEDECVWDTFPLVLSELLPNAIGYDTGNEFIEIYNPSDRTIDLSLYSVQVGVSGEKTYGFPVGSFLGPREYLSFSDSTMKFTLINTIGRVVLKAIDNSILGDSGIYENPREGESWAFIDDTWLYTNQATRNAENKASLDTSDNPAVGSTLASCQTGKYRNPLTNRCRNIETDASVLASCDVDEYRNPDTGRCRKITITSLVPCKDGQYRSEETNRCRNIVVASSKKPCTDNQYRSEATGRCRNLPVASVPNAAFGVKPVEDSAIVFMGWWVMGGVVLVAVGYSIWEWRREMIGLTKKVLKK